MFSTSVRNLRKGDKVGGEQDGAFVLWYTVLETPGYRQDIDDDNGNPVLCAYVRHADGGKALRLWDDPNYVVSVRRKES